MDKKQKQEYARLLYTKEGLLQKEIAKRVGVSENTITSWKDKGEWDLLKASMSIGRQQILQRLYDQVNELTAEIDKREKGKRYSNSKEADALLKLASAINKLEVEMGIEKRLTAFTDFLNWLRVKNLEKAQEFAELMDMHINTLI